MTIETHLITGVAFGFEYVPPHVTEENQHIWVVDIAIFRFLLCWDAA